MCWLEINLTSPNLKADVSVAVVGVSFKKKKTAFRKDFLFRVGVKSADATADRLLLVVILSFALSEFRNCFISNAFVKRQMCWTVSTQCSALSYSRINLVLVKYVYIWQEHKL